MCEQEVPEHTGIAAVRAAFAFGINYFDTSPFYGDTRSELVLGRGLQVRLDRFYLLKWLWGP